MSRHRDLLADLVTLARLIRTEADRRARAHGMTRAQWHILAQLERQPGLLQKELAEILEVEPITVARLIDRLETRGMVERRSDPGDRRCWRLHLTQAAHPLLGEIDEQLTDMAHILCRDLTDETMTCAAGAVAAMRDRAQAQRAQNPPEPACQRTEEGVPSPV